jgi:hypothetical protein
MLNVVSSKLSLLDNISVKFAFKNEIALSANLTDILSNKDNLDDTTFNI